MTNITTEQFRKTIENSYYQVSKEDDEDFEFFNELAAKLGELVTTVKKSVYEVRSEFEEALTKDDIIEILKVYIDIVENKWDFLLPSLKSRLIELATTLYSLPSQVKEKLNFSDDKLPEIPEISLTYRFTASTLMMSQKDDIALILSSKFRNYSAEVVNFISKNKSLLSFIIKAVSALKSYLPATSLDLGVVSELSTDDGSRINVLFIYVFSELEVQDALQKLMQFKEEWWIEKGISYLRKVNITIEFE